MSVQGFGVRWAFNASSGTPSTAAMTVAGGAKRFIVVSDSVKRAAPVVDSKGLSGTRKKFKGRARVPQEKFEGALTFDVTPEMLQFFMPYMTHDSSGSTPFEIAETVGQEFDFQRDDGATVYVYRNCVVKSCDIKGSSGDFCQLTLNVEAKSEAIDQTYDSNLTLTTTTAAEPIIMGEVTISLSGASRDCDDFSLTIDHGIEAKHRNNVGVTEFLPGMATITFSTNTVWGATEEGLWYGTNETGFAAVLTLGRASMQTVITLTNLITPDNAPAVSGPGELVYGIVGVAKGDLPISSTKEISVTVDSTP